MMKKIFELNTKKVTKGRKTSNKELHNMHVKFSPNITWVITSRRVDGRGGNISPTEG
jgi:hypothetical protein